MTTLNPTLPHQPESVQPKIGLRARVSGFLRRLWNAVAPGETAWRGAGIGFALLTLAILVPTYMTTSARLQITGVALVVAAVLLGLLVSDVVFPLLVGMYNRMPRGYRRALLWGMTVLILLANTSVAVGGTTGMLAMIAWVLFTGSLIGMGVAALVSRQFSSLTLLKKALMVAGLVIGVILLALGVYWIFTPGTLDASPPNAAAATAANVIPLNAADPSQPGEYKVLTLTYGSGTDRNRPEYGSEADIITTPVDGSPFVGNWAGLSGDIRTNYWGFDAKALPVNARVWYPDGAGTFPLFLIVHGNHDMTEFSDPGYAYLGELLASHGFIVASVDENFLNGNGGVDYTLGGLNEENDLRGWLLLEHLKQWQRWNQMRDNPFFQKVDMRHVAVGGHSRGGEAALVAAAFNRLPYYPGNATISFDYNFNIRAVVAIAPIDGQYWPNQLTPLENTNYFVLHGGYDGDLVSFDGVDVFDRVKFDDGGSWFKSALWIAGANHGQFNTVWGRNDSGGFAGSVLNTAPLMPGDDQRQVAKVFITAFLQASLKGQDSYRALFRDPRAGGDWLPDTVYLSQYSDSSTRYVVQYGEDINAATTTMPGGTLKGEDLTVWREQRIGVKWGMRETSAAYIGWDRTVKRGEPAYKLTLPEAGLSVDANSVLVMALARANESANPAGLKPEATPSPEAAPQPETDGTIDFTIVLIDRNDHAARLPLSTFSAIQPQISAQIRKAPFGSASSEPIMQTFEFPLSAFAADNPDFDPARIKAVWLAFNRTPSGVIILDNLGFRAG